MRQDARDVQTYGMADIPLFVLGTVNNSKIDGLNFWFSLRLCRKGDTACILFDSFFFLFLNNSYQKLCGMWYDGCTI